MAMTDLAIAPADVGEAVQPFPKVDPSSNQIIVFLGRKHSGKSAAAREFFRDWQGSDRWVIDPTGDADPGDDLGTVKLGQLPAQLPARPRRDGREVPGVWRWIANPMSPTYTDDLDRAVGLALFPKGRRTLTWADEAADVFPSGKVGPHGRMALRQSRHWQASFLICNPRPITLDPLVLQQADRVLMFDVPGAEDRDRIAQTIGWPRRPSSRNVAVSNVAPGNDLESLLNEVARLPYHYLMYVSSEHRMYLCPPLPLS